MKQQEVFKKIGIILKELNEQYDYLATSGEGLNDLELELFVANTHFLADHSEVLRKLNLQNGPAPVITPLPEATKEEKYFEPVVQQIQPSAEVQPEIEETTALQPLDTPAKPIVTKTSNIENDRPVPHIDLRGDDTGGDYSYVREEPKTIRHELKLDDIPNWDDEDDEGFVSEELTEPEEEIIKTPPAKVAKPEPVQPKKETIRVETKVNDVHEEPMTINQRMSAQLKNTGSGTTEQIHAQPVADLKQAITLNDKLLYIKDLFNGYNLAYSEAIEILNRITSFEEADKFLQSSYANKNDWASKQATADKFYELLKRRYA